MLIHASTLLNLFAAVFNDLYSYDSPKSTWTAISSSGSAPSSRRGMGFAATANGMLYVFGGDDDDSTGEKFEHSFIFCLYHA